MPNANHRADNLHRITEEQLLPILDSQMKSAERKILADAITCLRCLERSFRRPPVKKEKRNG